MMSKEAANVEILREAYGKWHDTKGGSLDHFLDMADLKSASVRSHEVRPR